MDPAWCASLFQTVLNTAYEASGCSLTTEQAHADTALAVLDSEEERSRISQSQIPADYPPSVDDVSSPRHDTADDPPEATSVCLGKRIFHGSRVSTTSLAGLRRTSTREMVSKENQDRSCVSFPFGEDEQQVFFGMFDGHGENGHIVSAFCARQVQHFAQQHHAILEVPGEALTAAFEHVDTILQSSSNIYAAQSGTTAVAAIMRGHTLWVANAGDSRAVVGRVDDDGFLCAVPLTSDHKPDGVCFVSHLTAHAYSKIRNIHP